MPYFVCCAHALRAKHARFERRQLRGRLWHAATFKTLEQAGSASAVAVRYDADWLIILHGDGGGNVQDYNTQVL